MMNRFALSHLLLASTAMCRAPSDDFNLADLAGIDTTEVREVRLGEKFPAGIFDWEISEPELADDKVEKDGVTVQRLKAMFKLKCLDIVELKEDLNQKDREALAGKVFTHTIMRNMIDPKEKSLEEFIGMIKAFLVDVGCNGNGKLRDLMEGSSGHRFRAPVVYTRNPNDKDNPYVNLRTQKAQPLPKAA